MVARDQHYADTPIGYRVSGHGAYVEQNVPGAIAWIISLLTFPYVALPAYWFFGRPRFYGYVTARGERDNVLRRVLVRYRHNIKPHLSRRLALIFRQWSSWQ